ncbi:NAD(P)-dependent alcohol dehydrogenase [Algoriphagus sp. H41]|uniref:NAD(P)-dependent alcohol dehydrogenase n=1 Tax=Algoriphagus oliviformis TaxID=2811231 RepID=A0ABS3C9H8_9BACT|nr:NAD(P)-dependent alcohol dehydrogenase [Algoriphagus oliviformis]MBN7813708.1 NAD(P)-dependent alcohol dehydrogenase [Algoriphagus oliviformis]
MKAIVFKRYGEPEVLHVAEIKKPAPKNNEVLIRIFATSVTAEDPKMRGFNHPPLLKLPVGLMFGFKKPKNPVLGIEFSGTIEAIGKEVKKYKIGDEVFGYTGLSFGAYAEYKCMPENGLMHYKPENLTFEESACMVNGPLSALAYMKKKGNIKQGDKVLIYGASGSVGTAAVQLAKYFGAHVTGVCSTKNIELVSSIGADIVIDYTCQDFTQTEEKYDLLFDTVGKTSMKECLKLLRPKGRYLLTEFGFSHILASIFTSLFKSKKVMVVSSNFYWKNEDLELFIEIAEKGFFKPVIDKTFPLERIIEAHKYVELGHKAGNVAISIK